MSADSITLQAFQDALARYPEILDKFNKPRDDGFPTLKELDTYRYVTAPSRFSTKAGGQIMTLEDLEQLMDWKLTHGTYRPSLAKLIRTNSDDTVANATKDAFSHYASNPSDIVGTLKKITDPLKGVGPATASLILSIHDPEQVIFFSDEVYRWLVKGGEKVTIKYNAKEFEEIQAQLKIMQTKLDVSPIEIEKVAFVTIKENEPEKIKAVPKVPSGRPRGRPSLPESEKKAAKPKIPGRSPGRPRGSSTTAAAKTPARRGRPAGSSSSTKAEVKTPTKRGRPPGSSATVTANTPAKRGRPPGSSNIAAAKTPAKRGRPSGRSATARANTPAKRGRPPGSSTTAAAKTPAKRGRPASTKAGTTPKSGGKRKAEDDAPGTSKSKRAKA